MNQIEDTNTYLFDKQRFSENDHWMLDHLLYECIMGSHAYGCQNEDSDTDIVGLVMDPHKNLYPQSYGFILGFDQIPKFRNKEVKGEDKRITLPNKMTCEGSWHCLTDFFHLVEGGSPNLTEVLFVKRHLVTFGSEIAWYLRDNRKTFLSMRMYHSFKGYAISQFVRIQKEAYRWKTEGTCDNKNRIPLYEKTGFDSKMSYHTLRLLDLIHQLLTEGDLDLMRNKEECKAMRSGEWGNFEKFSQIFNERMGNLEKLSCELTAVPVQSLHEKLKSMLAHCIEMRYGSESLMQKQTTEYVSVQQLWDKLDKMEKNLKIIKNNSI